MVWSTFQVVKELSELIVSQWVRGSMLPDLWTAGGFSALVLDAAAIEAEGIFDNFGFFIFVLSEERAKSPSLWSSASSVEVRLVSVWNFHFSSDDGIHNSCRQIRDLSHQIQRAVIPKTNEQECAVQSMHCLVRNIWPLGHVELVEWWTMSLIEPDPNHLS